MTKTKNMYTRKRREFLRQLTLGSAAFVFIPSCLASCHQDIGTGGNQNSIDLDGILPVAFINDCANLILKKGNLSEITKQALTADINLNIPGNMSRIAGTMQFPDQTVLEMIGQIKEAWEYDTPDTLLKQKYSLFLGYIIYSGFRESTGKLYHKLIDNGSHYDDIRICHDTYMLNHLCFDPDSEPELPADSYHELYNILLPRMITRLHTFKPDAKDGKKWINDMTRWRISNKELLEKYAETLIHPNKEHIEKFVVKPGFYNPGNDIIQLARKIQNNIPVSGDDIKSTLKSDPGNSIYAKSLVKGINKAEWTDKYFSGEIKLGDFMQEIAEI